LADGRLVAVKTLSLDKSQQGEKEFLAEVRMITSIQHKNLVRLLGCCTDGPQKILVYEYMKNRSLDLIIYGISALFSINCQHGVLIIYKITVIGESTFLEPVHVVCVYQIQWVMSI